MINQDVTTMNIMCLDYEDYCMEQLAVISMNTALTVGPKFGLTYEGWLCFGFNVYAVDGDRATLLETYETHDEAIAIRDDILGKLMAGHTLVVI